MKLREVLSGIPVVEAPTANPDVTGIAYDSRAVKPGDCFVAIPGTRTDGHRFVEVALRDGAAVALVQRRVGTAWPQVEVLDTRQALALASANFYEHPTRAMLLVGVTGTDGKTTTTTMLHRILMGAGIQAGAITTVDVRIGDAVEANESRQTTPEAPDIQALLARMRDEGARCVVLETSSHGLALQRVTGCQYDVAVFTNIAHEHLDFHKTEAAYREAKARLVDLTAAAVDKGIPKTAVLNRDDPSYPYLAQRRIAQQLTYGVQLDADLKATRIDASPKGIRFEATTPSGNLEVALRLGGRWNVYNALAAASAALTLRVPLDQVKAGLESVDTVTGRMEAVDVGQPFSVVIDYAHTPQSLEKVLRELRPVTRGRLIAVFGSAGERDREKRAWMGEIAARLADYAVFTNEDPREEDARQVIDEIAAGAEEVGWRSGPNYVSIEDRGEAIAHAVEQAQPGDTLLLAGKGHERSIFIGREKLPWDERAAAEAAIRRRLETSA